MDKKDKNVHEMEYIREKKKGIMKRKLKMK